MLRVVGEVQMDSLARVLAADLVLVACGYESRARDAAESYAFSTPLRYAIAFGDSETLAFDANLAHFAINGYSVARIGDAAIAQWLTAQLSRLEQVCTSNEISVFIDISSQSRSRIAGMLESIVRASSRTRIRVFFGYSVAAFSSPITSATPTISLGPVSPFFAGWSTDPDLPTSLVVGLGYEQDRAVGAVEFLEPTSIWALIPKSSLSDYDTHVQDANRTLLEQIDGPKKLTYLVEDPNTTLALLAPLVHRLSRDSSVLLLPSGPKILVLLCLLLSCLYRSVAVWRASAGADEPPVDRKPSGRRFVLECEFDCSNSSTDASAEAPRS